MAITIKPPAGVPVSPYAGTATVGVAQPAAQQVAKPSPIPWANPAPAPLAIRDFAAKNGLAVNYDNKTKGVTVTDPKTGKTINFASGTGQQYGMGGTYTAPGQVNGYNVVADPALLLKQFAPDPVQQPAVAPNGGLANAVTNINSQIDQSGTKYDAQRQSETDLLNKYLSADNYNTILQGVLQQLMPSYQASAVQLNKQGAQNANAIDADAERRGLFNSGAAAQLQQENKDSTNQALASILADLQAKSVDQARQAVTQQLQGAGMQGDWTTSDRGMSLDEINSKMANFFGLDNSNQGWANIGINQQNADTNKQNANTNQQNANTNQQQMKNDYALGLGNLNLNQQKLQQDADQFTQNIAMQKDFHADDMKNFAAQQSLDWAKLSSDNKIGLINANANALQAQIAQGKFNSEEDLIKAQNAKQKFTDMSEAYTMLGQLDTAGSKAGKTSGQIKQDKLTAIKPYQAYDPDLYNQLVQDINSDYTNTTSGINNMMGIGNNSGMMGDAAPYNTGVNPFTGKPWDSASAPAYGQPWDASYTPTLGQAYGDVLTSGVNNANSELTALFNSLFRSK